MVTFRWWSSLIHFPTATRSLCALGPLYVRSFSHNFAITLIRIRRGQHAGHTTIQRYGPELSQISIPIWYPHSAERAKLAGGQRGLLRLTFSCTVKGRKPKQSASESLKFEYKGIRKGTYRQAKHSPLSSPSLTTFPTLPIRNTRSQTPYTSNTTSYPCKQRFRISPSETAGHTAESRSCSVASHKAREYVRKCRRDGWG